MMLAVCAAVYGVIAALVFRRLVDAARTRVIVNRILAHVMEFALFIDEPRLILKAQLDLIKDNVLLLRRIALPCVLMAIPFALLELTPLAAVVLAFDTSSAPTGLRPSATL